MIIINKSSAKEVLGIASVPNTGGYGILTKYYLFDCINGFTDNF